MSADSSPANAAVTAATPTVLVVDDEAQIRSIVSMALEMRGLCVLAAGDGEEALRQSAGHAGRIDLVITDVQLPGISGAEMVRRLLADRPGVHVLYISGGHNEKSLDGGTIGKTAFLPKPFTPRELLERVGTILPVACAG